MAHDLFGNRMAFVGDVPWHGLGKEVPPNVSAAVMCKAAGLDWKVEKMPAPGARLTGTVTKTHDRYLVCREPVGDEKGQVALGMVGAGYEPLQNSKAFAFFEPFIENGSAVFHTAGALGNGERVWVLAQLKEQIVIGQDDEIERFLLLSNSHDGSGAVSVRFTPIRVVCQNTLNYALKQGGKGAIAVRHTRHLARHLAKAQAAELHRIVQKTFADAAKLFAAMALRTVTEAERNTLLGILFPPSSQQKDTGREPERWHRIRNILNTSAVTPPETALTLWAFYNAIVRDEDYRSSREAGPDARLERVWFGSGHDLKLRVLNLCRDHLQKAA